ncbi:MerR HTH family regulatory protein [Micromonospora nigra]|uniref:MerR HTH family regulatory protein n=1 Tax=Micromonospora nigra TaxID=145857 RepID=A0A1C6T3Q1_9ACTN|nr:MerR family transcriptional regulator [Micromonospora nigra]SCL36212.1 MerR HTH family regulatory protein [Micromonospora nigra]
MRLSELSRATDVPTATVKWYLRVGLLPKGTPTAANQARYDVTHVRRLRLVRALIETGRLSVDASRRVCNAIDDEDVPLHEVLGIAHHALAETGAHTTAGTRAISAVDAFLDQRGWQVRNDAPARDELAAVLTALAGLRASGAPPVDNDDSVTALLNPYADAVDTIAATEVAAIDDKLPRDEIVERVVLGTILMERASGALRRLAQEHHWTARHPT